MKHHKRDAEADQIDLEIRSDEMMERMPVHCVTCNCCPHEHEGKDHKPTWTRLPPDPIMTDLAIALHNPGVVDPAVH